jgi:hypothetical protein
MPASQTTGLKRHSNLNTCSASDPAGAAAPVAASRPAKPPTSANSIHCALRQLLAGSAQRAQQPGFADALVLRAHQRRVQHQHAGREREQEQELHRRHHLVDHTLDLAHHAADVDHRQIGEIAHVRLTSAAFAGGRWNAVIQVCGMPFIAEGLMMTKKLTRIEPHSSLRKLVIGTSTVWPAMSKRSRSPSFRFKVLARPASTDASGLLSSNHLPAADLVLRRHLDHGRQIEFAVDQPLGAIFDKGLAGDGVSLICEQRPRIIGYSSG